jgi:probable HAF family extracellular repeat protein
MRLLTIVGAPLVSASAALAQSATISYVPTLGATVYGVSYSVATGATPDGAYVVGYCSNPQGTEAYRWNRATGQLTGLGYLGNADWFYSTAHAVSDDGSVVVGRSDMDDHSTRTPHAFKWTAQTGMVALPYATTAHQFGPQGAAAVGVSGDGSVIVGRFESFAVADDGASSEYPAFMREWCRWTPSGVELLPVGAAAAFPGQIGAVSGDGAAIAGFVGDQVRATLLVGATGTPLGQLAGGQRAEPIGISRDGTVVVGAAETRGADGLERFHAFRWRAADGMVDLGGLPGSSLPSRAAGASAGGAIIVGSQGKTAVVWDSAHGARDIAAALTSLGVDLQGRVLREAVWVSPDGTWIAGNADAPSGAMLSAGWIAHIPQ